MTMIKVTVIQMSKSDTIVEYMNLNLASYPSSPYSPRPIRVRKCCKSCDYVFTPKDVEISYLSLEY